MKIRHTLTRFTVATAVSGAALLAFAAPSQAAPADFIPELPDQCDFFPMLPECDPPAPGIDVPDFDWAPCTFTLEGCGPIVVDPGPADPPAEPADPPADSVDPDPATPDTTVPPTGGGNTGGGNTNTGGGNTGGQTPGTNGGSAPQGGAVVLGTEMTADEANDATTTTVAEESDEDAEDTDVELAASESDDDGIDVMLVGLIVLGLGAAVGGGVLIGSLSRRNNS